MRLQSLAPRVAIAAALLAVLAFGGAGRAAVRDAVLNPVNPVLPSATIGKQYGVRFEVLVDGQRSGYGLFGCKLDTGRADLPTFDDCAKLPPGLQLRSVAGCTYEQGLSRARRNADEARHLLLPHRGVGRSRRCDRPRLPADRRDEAVDASRAGEARRRAGRCRVPSELHRRGRRTAVRLYGVRASARIRSLQEWSPHRTAEATG